MKGRIARLERILRHRERLERLAEGEFAEARRLAAARRERLGAVESARRVLLTRGGPPPAGTVDHDVLQTEVAYRLLLLRRMEARRGALQAAEREEAARLDALLERRRARRAIEVVIERREERERKRRQRRERARLDEVAASRWWRSLQEEAADANPR